MPHRPDAAARPVRLDGIRPAPTRRRGPLRAAAATGALAAGLASSAPAADLADYFGFEGLEIVKIGRDAGPIATADMDGDGLLDLVVVNNHASRLEIHHQRADASPEDAARGPALAPDRVNEIPEHWRFRRQNVPLSHRVSALIPTDFDGDGRMDVILAGAQPRELVFLRQTEPGVYDMTRRHRVRSLAATRSGFALTDVIGDERPDLLSLEGEDVVIWPLEGDAIGQPTRLSAGDRIVAFFVEDFDGDGRSDVVGILPDDPAPVRLWMGGAGVDRDGLGAQVRFEMPPLIEFQAVRLPGVDAARMAVIESVSKRLLVHELTEERIETTGDREASVVVHGFDDTDARQRDHAVVDLDGDGLLDLLATDTAANTVVAHLQVKDRGLQPGRPHPSLADLTYLVAGDVDDDPMAEIFVLSEEEAVVGRSDATSDGRIPFPRPMAITEGHEPSAMNLVRLEDGWRLAVVASRQRTFVVELLAMDGTRETVELGRLSKGPDTIVALDADQNGRTDLLLFTEGKPMTMLEATDEGFTLRDSEAMGQFGLVQAASADNVGVMDVDGDGLEELLIADRNFVRAVRYELEPEPGVSPGWQVVTQINTADAAAELISLTTLGDRIVAADGEGRRLVMMAASPDDPTRWRERESIIVRGFEPISIQAGSFAGDEAPEILAIGRDGFAIVQLSGSRVGLRQVTAYRSDDERRRYHELLDGDVNGDGFVDLVALDAGEQMCDFLSFSEAGNLVYATGFQVFESKLFTGGDGRQYEPSHGLIADLTGDGADDLILLCHDRVLLYPQATAEGSGDRTASR